MELFGRKNLGEGALDLEKPELSVLPILDVEKIEYDEGLLFKRELISIFDELNINKDSPIYEQEPNPIEDRKILDNVIFDLIGLNEDERKELYLAFCDLVKFRLDKSTTFK